MRDYLTQLCVGVLHCERGIAPFMEKEVVPVVPEVVHKLGVPKFR